MNMILTHIDSPRIDLKVNPLYEDSQIALLKTQYYGGIKKYQWPTIPLELHGVVTLQNGKTIRVNIGDNKDDPIFVITDLLPHAAGKQMERKASEIVQGEELNIMVGSIPVKNKKGKERVKQAIVEHLYKKYGMIEEDFVSAEIEAVPAFEVRDLGFDRSFIGGYGHDDRSSSYTALRAMLDIKGIPERTTLLFWSDKEEVGSYGATGAQSNFLYHVIGNILRLFDPAALDTSTRDLLSNSCALSGDVDAAFDPDYKDVHDERNTAQLNHGVTITKYTGVRGKYGANDADAEYVGKVRKLFNENGIVWQTGLVSKVDVGGGGTIALYLAALGIHIVDCGPAVLSMHSPFEVISKADLFATYEAYKVFFEKMK
jgi:aspartyl aminopeptidase